MDAALLWELFAFAILSGLLAGIVCPAVGSFLLVRRTGFFGITLPQFAACGLAFGYAILPWWTENIGLAGMNAEEALESPHAIRNYSIAWAGAFTFAGLSLLAFLGRREETETGRVAASFAIAVSATLLLAVWSPIGKENIETLLRGEILTVDRHEFETIGVAYVLVLMLLTIYFRDLTLVSYDRETAVILGKPVRRFEALLLGLVGLTVSAGVLIVGPVVLFGLLVIPPLAAHGIARSMRQFVILSSVFGVLASAGGMYVSFTFDWPLGPSLCAVAAVELIPVRIYRTFTRG